MISRGHSSKKRRVLALLKEDFSIALFSVLFDFGGVSQIYPP